MVLEFESMTGRQPPRAGLPMQDLMLRLQFIEAHIREAFAFVMLRSTRPDNRKSRIRPCRICGTHSGKQRSLRLLEIKILHGVGHRLRRLFHSPIRDHFPPGRPILQFMEGNFGVTGKRLMRTDGVRQDQRMFAILMLEVIVDSLLLHQPAHEVEIGFTILDTVFPLGVGGAEFEFVITKPKMLEDIFNDVGHGHVLKDAAVGRAREKPQPRDDGRLIMSIAPLVGRLYPAG